MVTIHIDIYLGKKKIFILDKNEKLFKLGKLTKNAKHNISMKEKIVLGTHIALFSKDFTIRMVYVSIR